MPNTLNICATLVTIASLSSCVTTVDGVQQKSESIIAVSGEKTYAGQSWMVKQNCSLSRIPNVRVMEQPKHGRVEIGQEEIYPDYRSGDYKKCNAVKVMGVRGYYTSAPSYVGRDAFKVRTSYGTGSDVEDAVINVNVVK